MQASETAVVTFEPRHAAAFRDLNMAWLEQHFVIEAKDRVTLDDPQGCVIDRGGVILIAEDDERTALGCVALIPYADAVLELAKMAVADKAKGRGIGRRLMEAAVAQARTMNARALYLESNSSLVPAVTLYERSGFRHLTPTERPYSPYARCDVYMRLDL